MDEIVGVVTVMFAAVKLEHAHPLRRDYRVRRVVVSAPSHGPAAQNGFIQRAGAGGNGLNRAR